MRRVLKWLLRGGLGLVLVALVVAVSVREIRDFVSYAVAPAYARNKNFVRLKKGAVSLHLLGTIHGKHLSTPAYTLAILGAAISKLKPTMLFVEARPEELARGRLGDGPIEMPFATLHARSLGIEVRGIDWWVLQAGKARRTDDLRDDKIFQHLLRQMPSSGRALVLVGYSHIPELVSRLKKVGFTASAFPPEEKEALFASGNASFRYPAGMAAAISQRIKDLEAKASKSDAAVAKILRGVSAARASYLSEIRRVGEKAR